MWEVNAAKLLKLFERVYISSDDPGILNRAVELGALPIKRNESLCGDVPNIPVYRHALEHMENPAGIFAVQANSPTLSVRTLMNAKTIMELGVSELMTCHPDYKIYGSIWAMTTERLEDYGDPYKPTPEVLLIDDSVDIHTKEDLEKALCQRY